MGWAAHVAVWATGQNTVWHHAYDHESYGYLRLVKLTLRCGGTHVCEMHPVSERSACYAVELSQTHSLFFAAHTCRAFWSLRTRMLQHAVNQIGMALKAGTMTPDEVDERLAELEMLDIVYPELMGCEQ